MGVHGDGRIIDRVAAAAGAEMAPLLAVHKRGSVVVKCHVRVVRRARATWVASWSDAYGAPKVERRILPRAYVRLCICPVWRVCGDCVGVCGVRRRWTAHAVRRIHRPPAADPPRGICYCNFRVFVWFGIYNLISRQTLWNSRLACAPAPGRLPAIYMCNLARSRLRHVHVPRACTPSRPFHLHMASIGMRPCSDRSRVARRDDKVSGA